MEIISLKEAREKGLKHYYTGKPCKYGHFSIRRVSAQDCVTCIEIYLLVNKQKLNNQKKEYRSKNKEKISNHYKQKYWDEKTKDPKAFKLKKKLHRDKYRDSLNEGKKRYYQANKEECLKKSGEWQRKNRERANELKRRYRKKHGRKGEYASRRAMKLERTPKWANLTIVMDFYKNAPKGFHVDHIIPLQGKLVSGLHVETNLQYLTRSENCTKSNKFTPYREKNGTIEEFYD